MLHTFQKDNKDCFWIYQEFIEDLSSIYHNLLRLFYQGFVKGVKSILTV